MKTKMMMLVLVLCSWGAFAQHDHAAMKNEKAASKETIVFKDMRIAGIYEHYTHLKNAFVDSNKEEVASGAAGLEKALRDAGASVSAISAASAIGSVSDMKEQRKVFSVLSDEVAKILKGGQLSAGVLYVDYCPMANSGQGAYWVSSQKEIKNPYFGDAMLHCGSVKETIR